MMLPPRELLEVERLESHQASNRSARKRKLQGARRHLRHSDARLRWRAIAGIKLQSRPYSFGRHGDLERALRRRVSRAKQHPKARSAV